MTVLMLDVDGVLVTGTPEPFARDEGLDAALEVARGTLTPEDWHVLATGRDDLLRLLTRRLSPGSELQPLVDYWFRSEAHIDRAVLADLRRLRADGLKIYLATNQEHHRARYLMETLQLAAEVDGMAYSAKLRYRKPSREYFTAATSMVGVSPRELVFIDDNAENVAAARLAGWRATHWLGDMNLEAAISAAR